tara:strand:- start:289 stop:1191 length:903 start_codon:yes stop_codon:yes gene_type:complete
MTDLEFNRLSSQSTSATSILKFVVNRYEEIYFRVGAGVDSMSEVSSDVQPTSHYFDPELFILPNSIQYNPFIMQEDGTTHEQTVNGIFLSTNFYRIRGGTIIEEIKGADIVDSALILAAKNCLHSYILDLYMYETSKIRYNDFACLTGPPELTPAGYNFLSHVSSNTQMSRVIASRSNFINLFNKNNYKLKTPSELKQLLTSQIEGLRPDHNVSDLYTAGYLSLVPMLTNNESIIATRKYERTYNILYNETQHRNGTEFSELFSRDQSAAGESLAWGDASHRGQYDGFSLRVAVDRIPSS